MTEKQRTCIQDIIRRNRTWIELVCDSRDNSTYVRSGSSIHLSKRKVFILRTRCKYRNYYEGHIWYVPLLDIDNVCRNLSKKDLDFKERWASAKITRNDVEQMFLIASRGVISLELEFYERKI